MSIYEKGVQKENVIHSVLWTSGVKGISQVTALVTTFILVRLITKNDFGLMAMAIVYMGLVDNVLDFGILTAIIQRKEIKTSTLSTCFWFLMVTSSFIFGLTFLAAPVIAAFFKSDQLSYIIMTLGIVFLCLPSQIIAQGVLARHLRLDLVAKAELAAAVMRFIVAIYLAVIGAGVWSLVFAYIVEKIVLAIVLPLLARWYPRWVYNFQEIKSLLVFGGNVTASRILWYVYNRLDFIIIGRLLGSDILGVYSIASQVARAFAQLTSTSVYRVLYPVFSSYQDNYLKLGKVFLKASMILASLTMPLFLGLCAVAPNLVPVLMGSKWLDAIYPVQVLSIVAALQVMMGLSSLILNAIGKPVLNVYFNIFSTVIMCIGFVLGSKWYGLYGVLLAWLILMPIRSLILFRITTKNINLSLLHYLMKYLRTLLPGLLMFALVVSINTLGLEWPQEGILGFQIVIGVTSYLLLQFVFCRDTFDEIFSLLNKKRKRIV
jgi:O-antigen/teichoic acid export membrane protein